MPDAHFRRIAPQMELVLMYPDFQLINFELVHFTTLSQSYG